MMYYKLYSIILFKQAICYVYDFQVSEAKWVGFTLDSKLNNWNYISVKSQFCTVCLIVVHLLYVRLIISGSSIKDEMYLLYTIHCTHLFS